ncbi:MAG: hypothetical protein Q7R79_02000 [bacterium]|nr:hypothetical protein [bacterium]
MPIENTSRSPRRPGQHVVPGVLLFLLLGVFFYGAQNIIAKVKQPFDFPDAPDSSKRLSDILQEATDEDTNAYQLKAVDTDGDTLSDYDELYIYRTSPYLADTDSDGYKDNEELAKGYDPNCPSGRDCTGNDVAKKDSDLLAGLKPESVKQLEALRNATPEEIRKLLKEKKGYTDEQLNAIDDKTLVEMYQKGIDEATAKTTEAEKQGANTAVLNPYTMTPAQIREMIKTSGRISEDQLNKIDDATLLNQFQEVLKKKEIEER